MLAWIKGDLIDRDESTWVLKVESGADNGVGYQIHVPPQMRYQQTVLGTRCELFLYTHVREDAFELFGFFEILEKRIFLALLSVNGIGPKTALHILGAADLEVLIEWILDENVTALKKLPGIGQKTAERLVVELRDRFKKGVKEGKLSATDRLGAASGASAGTLRKPVPVSRVQEELQGALLGLGFREADIELWMVSIGERLRTESVEVLIKQALKVRLRPESSFERQVSSEKGL